MLIINMYWIDSHWTTLLLSLPPTPTTGTIEFSRNTQSWQCCRYCITLSGNKLVIVKSWINVNADLDLLWCTELELKWPITVTNLCFNLSSTKMPTLLTLCITGGKTLMAHYGTCFHVCLVGSGYQITQNDQPTKVISTPPHVPFRPPRGKVLKWYDDNRTNPSLPVLIRDLDWHLTSTTKTPHRRIQALPQFNFFHFHTVLGGGRGELAK